MRWLAGAVLLLSASHLAAQDDAPLSPATSKALGSAITLAKSALKKPACRMLLGAYTDSEGRALERNLDALGASPSAYLGWLSFHRASAAAARCTDPSVVFFTVPSSRVVFACEGRLERLEPRLAGALVLHEALHTLGLGENPPSPSQITARVREKCEL